MQIMGIDRPGGGGLVVTEEDDHFAPGRLADHQPKKRKGLVPQTCFSRSGIAR